MNRVAFFGKARQAKAASSRREDGAEAGNGKRQQQATLAQLAADVDKSHPLLRKFDMCIVNSTARRLRATTTNASVASECSAVVSPGSSPTRSGRNRLQRQLSSPVAGAHSSPSNKAGTKSSFARTIAGALSGKSYRVSTANVGSDAAGSSGTPAATSPEALMGLPPRQARCPLCLKPLPQPQQQQQLLRSSSEGPGEGLPLKHPKDAAQHHMRRFSDTGASLLGLQQLDAALSSSSGSAGDNGAASHEPLSRSSSFTLGRRKKPFVQRKSSAASLGSNSTTATATTASRHSPEVSGDGSPLVASIDETSELDATTKAAYALEHMRRRGGVHEAALATSTFPRSAGEAAAREASRNDGRSESATLHTTFSALVDSPAVAKDLRAHAASMAAEESLDFLLCARQLALIAIYAGAGEPPATNSSNGGGSRRASCAAADLDAVSEQQVLDHFMALAETFVMPRAPKSVNISDETRQVLRAMYWQLAKAMQEQQEMQDGTGTGTERQLQPLPYDSTALVKALEEPFAELMGMFHQNVIVPFVRSRTSGEAVCAPPKGRLSGIFSKN